MSFFENVWQFLLLDRLGSIARGCSESLHTMTTVFSTGCDTGESDPCRDDSAAFVLKLVAMASIFLAGASGVSVPLIGSLSRRVLNTDGSFFVAAKAFAAGVILATGFVHMLSDGSDALSDPCLPETPWSKFPFSGFFAMIAALLTLLVDFMGTQYYERKHEETVRSTESMGRLREAISESDLRIGSGLLESGLLNEKVFGEGEGGGIHIVGMRAHHSYGHLPGQGGSRGLAKRSGGGGGGDGDHGHGHVHGFGNGEEGSGVRHVVVSQILELGIVSHSIIIGLSLGVSQSPCTIRPLIAALSFHQFFEGFALGGCISQAQFTAKASTMMACFFAFTTPIGIAVGTAVSSWYNPYSIGALVAEGILDSLSAGILVYMALVDLIAADFLSKKMSRNFRLQIVSYCLLFLGAGLMSSLAIWA